VTNRVVQGSNNNSKNKKLKNIERNKGICQVSGEQPVYIWKSCENTIVS